MGKVSCVMPHMISESVW